MPRICSWKCRSDWRRAEDDSILAAHSILRPLVCPGTAHLEVVENWPRWKLYTVRVLTIPVGSAGVVLGIGCAALALGAVLVSSPIWLSVRRYRQHKRDKRDEIQRLAVDRWQLLREREREQQAVAAQTAAKAAAEAAKTAAAKEELFDEASADVFERTASQVLALATLLREAGPAPVLQREELAEHTWLTVVEARGLDARIPQRTQPMTSDAQAKLVLAMQGSWPAEAGRRPPS